MRAIDTFHLFLHAWAHVNYFILHSTVSVVMDHTDTRRKVQGGKKECCAPTMKCGGKPTFSFRLCKVRILFERLLVIIRHVAGESFSNVIMLFCDKEV